MPAAIGAVILPIFTSVGVTAAIGATAAGLIATTIGYGITSALLYGASALLAPRKGGSAAPQLQSAIPKPEDGKYSLKQSLPPTTFVLGRVRKAGDYAALEEANGVAYHVIALCEHRSNAITGFWLHDTPVTLDGTSIVTPSNFAGYVHLDYKLGFDAETAYSNIVTDLPTIWTNDHRGDGITSMMMTAQTTPQDQFQTVYPNQMPQPTAIIEGALIYDPRSDEVEYTENIALFRLWHLTHPVGGKLTLSDLYLPDWEHAADVSDQIVTNRSGQDEYRYHGGFWFRASDDPVEVGSRIDQAGELVLYERDDGKIGVHAGELVTPTITIQEKDIESIIINANRSQSNTVIAVRGSYTQTTDDLYESAAAAIYGDPYADDTERTKTVDNIVVQSHNHIQRLQKLAYIRTNAPRVQCVVTYEAGRDIKKNRFIFLNYPPKLENVLVEITGKPQLSLRNLTVTFEGFILDGNPYEFDALTEEGVPPTIPDNLPASSPYDPPDDFNVIIRRQTVSGQDAPYGYATWASSGDAFVYQLQYEREISPGIWGETQTQSTNSGELSLVTSILSDGMNYQFRIRARSFDIFGLWTDWIDIFITADITATDPVTDLVATGGTGEITVAWSAPNNANYRATRIYLNTANDFSTAMLYQTEYGAAGQADTTTVDSVLPDDWYVWAVAINISGVEATPVVDGPVTVA